MRVNPNSIIVAFARHAGTTPEALCGPRRMMPLARTRQFAYLAAVELCPHLSLPQIGRIFGNRDHTTIMYGARVARRLIAEDPETAKWFNTISREIRHCAQEAEEYAHQYAGAA